MRREKTVAKTTLLRFFSREWVPLYTFLSFSVSLTLFFNSERLSVGWRMPNTLKLSLYTGFIHTEADGSEAYNQKRRLIYTHTHAHSQRIGIDCWNLSGKFWFMRMRAYAAPIHAKHTAQRPKSHIQSKCGWIKAENGVSRKKTDKNFVVPNFMKKYGKFVGVRATNPCEACYLIELCWNWIMLDWNWHIM